MSTPLFGDTEWEIVAPLLPSEPPKGGRPRSVTDRAALTGIVFVLKSGIPWEMLPQELGSGAISARTVCQQNRQQNTLTERNGAPLFCKP